MLHGYVPSDIIHTLRAFIEFCYFVQQNSHSTDDLQHMEKALEEYYHHHEVFVETGIRKPKSWSPRQHSLKHFLRAIRDFGLPNGLCSSITESKHIDAVKKPWRHSNCHNTLKQMLVTNTRSDKIRAAYNQFKSCGLLDAASDLDALIEGVSRHVPC